MSESLVGLFPDLLPIGGIQTVGRHTAAVLSRIADERGWQSYFLSLNDAAGRHESAVGGTSFEFHGFGRSKARFMLEALKLARANTKLAVAAHPNLAVLAFAMRAKSRGFPVVVMSHGIEVWKPLSNLRRTALRAADCVLAPSRDTATKLSEAQGIAAKQIRILHWGLDPAFLELTQRADDLSLPDSIPRARYVLAVGRWSSAERYKGFDTLILALPEILRAIPDVQLAFIGEGDDQPALEKLAQSNNVREHIRFISGLSREQLAAAYRHADVFALPSAGEGFGFVYLEAMAMGKPVIGGNHGGAPDIIEDGITGFLVPHGDVGRLANKLELLLTNASLAADMGRRGRERVLQHFRFEEFEAGLRDILAQVCPATRGH